MLTAKCFFHAAPKIILIHSTRLSLARHSNEENCVINFASSTSHSRLPIFFPVPIGTTRRIALKFECHETPIPMKTNGETTLAIKFDVVRAFFPACVSESANVERNLTLEKFFLSAFVCACNAFHMRRMQFEKVLVKT